MYKFFFEYTGLTFYTDFIMLDVDLQLYVFDLFHIQKKLFDSSSYIPLNTQTLSGCGTNIKIITHICPYVTAQLMLVQVFRVLPRMGG